MIRFAPANLVSPINLLDQQQAHHLVGKCHAGEGEFEIGPLAQLRGKAKGTADKKDNVAFSVQSATIDMGREFFGGQVLSKHIEDDAIAIVANML